MKKLLIVMTALAVLSFIPAVLYNAERKSAEEANVGHITAVQAAEDERILDGVRIGPVDVSGMTEREAYEAVEALINDMASKKLTVDIGGETDTLPLRDAGFAWVNTDAPKEAVALGKSGNILSRFKQIHDLEEEPYVIPLERTVNDDVIEGFIGQEAAAHDRSPVNAGLIYEDGEFVTTEPEEGMRVNQQASFLTIRRYLTSTWEGGEPFCAMDVETLASKGTVEELSEIRDVLGEGVTDFSSSGESRAKNVRNGTEKVNGHVVYPGETFSVLDALVPFNEENGYDPAPSFIEGRTEDSFGGGICQVSTTLYLAVLRAELEVVQRSSHSMTVGYVKPSMDAAIAEGSKDFVFRNNTDTPVYIFANADEGYVTMRIYGKETRDPQRKITFESEVLEESEPEKVNLLASSSHGFGYVKRLQSAQKGMTAQLWKIVTVNGTETERETVNYSDYQMTEATYRVGVVSGSEEATAKMYAACDEGSLDKVYNIINTYGSYHLDADDE